MAMSQIIGAHGGYRRTFAFGYACLVYHATCAFCRRVYDFKNDPLGKTTGQMVGAARSARQNIVEGSARAGTSKETELRLYDVAKGSLEELSGDYESFLIEAGSPPWRSDDPNFAELSQTTIDRYDGDSVGGNARNEYATYILEMRKRFSQWLESDDPIVAANSILIVIDQARRLIHAEMESVGREFAESGGFSERLTRERLRQRDEQVNKAGSPKCPKCGGPMRKLMAKKGANAGNPFWACCAYPNCSGSRPWEWK